MAVGCRGQGEVSCGGGFGQSLEGPIERERLAREGE